MRHVCLLERGGQVLLHELFLGGLGFPDLDDYELVARLAGDMVEEGRRPVTGTIRGIDIENSRHLPVELHRFGRSELEYENIRHGSASFHLGAVWGGGAALLGPAVHLDGHHSATGTKRPGSYC